MKQKTTAKIKNKPTLELSMTYILDDVPLNYTLRYKSVKNFNLRVNDGKSITLAVPHSTSKIQIQRFLDDHADFLRKALQTQKMRQRAWHRSLYEQTLTDGVELCILDQRIFLCITVDDANRAKPVLKVQVDSEDREIWQITLSRCKSRQEKDQVIQKLVIFEELQRLEREVAACLPEIGQKVMQAAENLGISPEISGKYPYMKFVLEPSTIRFRDMRSRWGSCTVQKGTLRINSRLIFAPVSCLRYVIGHELCHFIYPDHSAKFYRLLNAAIPDALETRKFLQGKS